jgi:hypothetical protein
MVQDPGTSRVVVNSVYVKGHDKLLPVVFEFHNTSFSCGIFSCVDYQHIFAVDSEYEKCVKE